MPFVCVCVCVYTHTHTHTSSTNTLLLSSLLPTTSEQYSHHDQCSKIWKCVEGIQVSLLQSAWKMECKMLEAGLWREGGYRWFCKSMYIVMKECSGLQNSRPKVYPYVQTTSFKSPHKLFVHWLPLQIFDRNFLSPQYNTPWIQHSAHPSVIRWVLWVMLPL